MLRRSTGVSPDMKRVGSDRRNDAAMGVVKLRCVAVARVVVCVGGVLLVDTPMVRLGVVLRAMLWRRRRRGSGDGLAIMLSCAKIEAVRLLSFTIVVQR